MIKKMMEEQKKQGEGSFSEEVNVEKTNSEIFKQEIEKEEKKTIAEWESEEAKNKKIQNLISAVIILTGLFVGSLFVDVSQLITKGGYSERALKNAEMFVLGDKTWIAHNEGPIELTVLTSSQEEIKDCPECDPTEVVNWLKQNFPTLVAKKVEEGSEEGKKMIEDYEIKTVPAFVFDKNVIKSEFYQNPQVQTIFDEKEDGKFLLNSVALGVPVGKYLEMPTTDEGDAILGNPEASTKMIIFSDFQCPYSKMFFDVAMKTMEDYKDKIAFVHKDLPLDFHAQARNAALAARCAQEQDKFWEMSEILFNNQGDEKTPSGWGNQEGIAIFSTYAGRIGLNTSDFNNCMKEAKFVDKIKVDEELAGNFGISGTPSGFIGDEFIGGVLEEDALKKVFDEQLAKNN